MPVSEPEKNADTTSNAISKPVSVDKGISSKQRVVGQALCLLCACRLGFASRVE